MTIKEAIDVLTNELKTDAGYRQSWVANIAMAFYDACVWDDLDIEHFRLHKLSNDAAEHFISMLCRGGGKQ
jgi:predicted membrane protein